MAREVIWNQKQYVEWWGGACQCSKGQGHVPSDGFWWPPLPGTLESHLDTPAQGWLSPALGMPGHNASRKRSWWVSIQGKTLSGSCTWTPASCKSYGYSCTWVPESQWRSLFWGCYLHPGSWPGCPECKRKLKGSSFQEEKQHLVGVSKSSPKQVEAK